MAIDPDQLNAELMKYRAFAGLGGLVDGDEPDADEENIGIEIGDDGTVTVDLNPPKRREDSDHFDNLAEKLGPAVLGTIANQVLEGIEADDASRKEWLATIVKGIDLLGIKMKGPRGDPQSAGQPVEGQSTVQHPLLLDACLRYQANARGEILPSSGPVKVVAYGDQTGPKDKLAESLEEDFNYYLTVKATEYVPDTDRMLFSQGFTGLGIKKVYNCPLRRRPVSESIDAEDFIVSNAATDLRNAARVTHRIKMRPSVLKRMQLVGAYRDVDLQAPSAQTNEVDEKKASIQGLSAKPTRQEDEDYEIYECYCELDIEGYEHEEDGKVTGLPLPYRVTVERNSREILAIHRNWDEDDEDQIAKRYFVLFPFVPAFGIYGLGLLHILGNSSRALTAVWREMLDAGMFASFPGFLYSKSGVGRQMTNEFRVPPGGGVGIDTGGMPISQAVMPLPYKGPDAALMQLADNIGQAVSRVGGTAEMQVGEGRQDAPVGTTIALIEQATKVMDAVHKRTHQAQGEEFDLLKERFKEDPESFWRGNKRSTGAWDEQKFLAALEDCNIVPRADPNVPSHMHRVMKATALKQLQAANPQLYDAKAVDLKILAMMHIDDPDSLFAPPAPPAGPQVDPMKMGDLQLKMQANQLRQADIAARTATSEAERKSKENLAILNMAKETIIHPESASLGPQMVQNVRGVMGPMSNGGGVRRVN